MEARLAATPVIPDQALARSTRIDELLKSTEESLARIGRLQSSPPRLSDPRPRRLEAAGQVFQAATQTSTTTTPLVRVPTTCSPLEGKQHLSAQHVFDGMYGRQEATTSHVLHVTVTCVLYPVTEKVLHQVFDPYGMNEVCILQRTTHVKAFVEFQSWHEAAKARGALHGRCIYDNCCCLSIQYASTSVIVVALTPSTTLDDNFSSPATFELSLTEEPPRTEVACAAPQVFATLQNKEGSNLTCVSSPSISLEHCLDSTDKIFNDNPLKNSVWDEESPDDVVTHVAGMSLFLEPGLKSVNEMFAERLSKDMASHVELSNEVLTYVGGLSLFLEFDLDMIVDSADQVLHEDLPWKCRALFPWSNTREVSHFLLASMTQNAFHSGQNGVPRSYLAMDKWSPWSRSGFSPGLGECLRYLFSLVCKQPSGNSVVDVTVQHAAALIPYNDMLTAPRNFIVATQDGREISTLVMHWHYTVLTVQWFGLLLQLQLHVFYCGSRGRQETEGQQADLYCFFILSCYSSFRGNETATSGRASKFRESFHWTPRTWIIAWVITCYFSFDEQIECPTRDGPAHACSECMTSSCHFVQKATYRRSDTQLACWSYSACNHLNWIILHNKHLQSLIVFFTGMVCLCTYACCPTSTWCCGQFMETVAGTLDIAMHIAVCWSVLGDYINGDDLLCTMLHLNEVCTILIQPWDPGVREIRAHSEMAKKCWQWLSAGVDWRRPYEPAIAWGQAIFLWGGSVTPVCRHVLGQEHMGSGPTGRESHTWSGIYKTEYELQSQIWNRTETN